MPVSECVLKTEAALKDVWGGGGDSKVALLLTVLTLQSHLMWD